MKEIYKDESTSILLGDGQIRICYKDEATQQGMIFQGNIATLATAMVKMMYPNPEQYEQDNTGN